MSWTRLDDGYDSNRKLLGLGDGQRGDARRWTWTRVLVYSNRMGSAEVPWNIGQIITRAAPAFLRDCLELGLLDEKDGVLSVHDWPLYADVTIEAKVQHYLERNPSASANEIAKAVGGKRSIALAEIERQRGTTEPPQPVPGNHRSGTRSGTTRVLPSRPDPGLDLALRSVSDPKAVQASTPPSHAGITERPQESTHIRETILHSLTRGAA